MASSYSPQSAPMDDPDHGWKPNRRPQSTLAQNFMTELDSLFKLDGGIEDLDRTVHEKKAAVNTQTRELEALEARLRATEERLNQAKGNSPPSKTNSQQKAQQNDSQPQVPESPLAQKTSNMPERPSSSKPEAA